MSAPGTSAAYPRPLSTRASFVFKFVFPVFILTLLASATVAVAFTSTLLALGFTVVDVLVFLLFWFYSWPIKQVVAYPDHLVVSNFFRAGVVPYHQIESVREVTWINWRPTIVTLKTPGLFGRSFMYYPTVDEVFGGFGERPATTFLRRHLA